MSCKKFIFEGFGQVPCQRTGTLTRSSVWLDWCLICGVASVSFDEPEELPRAYGATSGAETTSNAHRGQPQCCAGSAGGRLFSGVFKQLCELANSTASIADCIVPAARALCKGAGFVRLFIAA